MGGGSTRTEDELLHRLRQVPDDRLQHRLRGKWTRLRCWEMIKTCFREKVKQEHLLRKRSYLAATETRNIFLVNVHVTSNVIFLELFIFSFAIKHDYKTKY